MVDLLLVAEAMRVDSRTIVLSGEPGIGKSPTGAGALRAARRLAARSGSRASAPSSHFQHARPRGRPAPAEPATSIGPRAPSEDEWTRLVEAMAPLGAHRRARPSLYLADLLGVSPPEHLARGAATATRARSCAAAHARRAGRLDAAVVGRDAARRVVIEDLHWSDPTTLELLALLTEPPPGSRLLCVFTTRPEAQLRLAGRPPRHSRSRSRLLGDSSGAISPALLAESSRPRRRGRSTPWPIAATACRSSSRSSSRRPATEATAADNATRSHRRCRRCSRLASIGSVAVRRRAGRVGARPGVSAALLAAMSPVGENELERALDDLVAAGILMTRNTVHGVAYMFRHALIQDAAYASLLRRERRAVCTTRPRRAHVGARRPRSNARPSCSLTISTAPDVASRPADWYERAGRRAASEPPGGGACPPPQGLAVLDGPRTRSRSATHRLLSLNILLGNVLMGSSGIGDDAALPVWRTRSRPPSVGDDEELTVVPERRRGVPRRRGDTRRRRSRTPTASSRSPNGPAPGSRRSAGTARCGMVRFYQGDGEAALAHLETAMSLSRDWRLLHRHLRLRSRRGDVLPHDRLVGRSGGSDGPTEALELRPSRSRHRPPDPVVAQPGDGTPRARHRAPPARRARGSRGLRDENLALCTELGFPFWGGLARAMRSAPSEPARGDLAGSTRSTPARPASRRSATSAAPRSAWSSSPRRTSGPAVRRTRSSIADLGLAVGNDARPAVLRAQLLRLKAAGCLAPTGRRGPSVLEQSLTVADAHGRPVRRRCRPSSRLARAGRARRTRHRGGACSSDALAAMGDGATHDRPARRPRPARGGRASPADPRSAVPSSRRAPGRTATQGASMANPTDPPNGSPVYLSGPMFSAADLWQQAAIAAAARGGRLRDLPAAA